ncbi:MAG: NAD(P)H-dependent oxidoreductase subunit E [Armatimonadota bacterium]
METAAVESLGVDDRTKLDGILLRNGRRPELLIQVLQDIQAEFGHLPEDGLVYVAEQLGVPLPRAFHVATFYKAFSLRPRGKHIVNVCRGTACHVRGSERLVDTIERELGIRDGETTEDLAFTLECVNCLGACALAPVVVIDGATYGKVTPESLRRLLAELRAGGNGGLEPGAEQTDPASETPEVATERAPAEAGEQEPPHASPETEPARPTKKQRRAERRARRKAKKTGRKSQPPTSGGTAP